MKGTQTFETGRTRRLQFNGIAQYVDNVDRRQDLPHHIFHRSLQ